MAAVPRAHSSNNKHPHLQHPLLPRLQKTSRNEGGHNRRQGGARSNRKEQQPPPAPPAAPPATVPCSPLELSTGQAVKNTWVPVTVELPHSGLRFSHL